MSKVSNKSELSCGRESEKRKGASDFRSLLLSSLSFFFDGAARRPSASAFFDVEKVLSSCSTFEKFFDAFSSSFSFFPMLMLRSSPCAAAAASAAAPRRSLSRLDAARAPLPPRAPLGAARPSALSFARSSSSTTKLAAISKPTDASASAAAPVISIDNGADSSATVVRVAGANRPGLLTALTAAFRDLGLDVKKVKRRARERKKKRGSFAFSFFRRPHRPNICSQNFSPLSHTSIPPRPRSVRRTATSTTSSTSRW